MEAISVRAVAQEGRLVLENPAFHEGEAFEVTVLSSTSRKPGMVGDLLDSAFGIWADRDDIGDGVEYARKLRRETEENLRGS